MSDIWVRSTDGDNADNGSTRALAKATLAGADAIDAAGDRILVSQAHSESSSSSLSYSFAGTAANPTQVLCADDSAEPPTALGSGALIATTGTGAITVAGSAYIEGVNFTISDAYNFVNGTFNNSAANQYYKNLNIIHNGSHPSSAVNVGTNLSKTTLHDVNWKFAGTGNKASLRGTVHVLGGSFISGTASTGVGFNVGAGSTYTNVLIEGFDFSNLASTVGLIGLNQHDAVCVLRNCKLPASWTGNLLADTISNISRRVEMYNCDSGSTNYRLWIEDYYGTIRDEATLVRTGGANDGTTGLSWKMTGSASVPLGTLGVLRSPEIVQWNETTGSSVTATVEILHDTNVSAGQGAGASYAFQNDEVWLEVDYLGTSGYPISSRVSSKKVLLATAADLSSSSETWTTTGMTTPVKQKMSVTFTPQKKGFIHARVVVSRASKTVYVCPKMTVA